MATNATTPDRAWNTKHLLGASLGLTILTFLCYGQVLHHDFVSFDDPEYVLDNRHVSSGLSWAGLKWAFNIGYASNWHPVTWLSHMLDCSLYGSNPAGHHFTNVTLHIAVTLLVFGFLLKVTGALWRSALVAALFAWHPLHVESVAWASERKDILSAFFFMLSLWAYANYARPKHTAPTNRMWAAYLLSLAAFTLGLMSKPMLVTLPFVLLLLDVWPLKRIFETDGRPRIRLFSSLVLEKIPFFALALTVSVITVFAQKTQGAVASLQTHPLSQRLANALVSYARYLGKTFWPADLVVIYPYPVHWPMVLVLMSAALVAGGCVLVCLSFRRHPYLFTGWFWFLGMLVPTIGLVQVGAQSIADRYMYLPSIGLFVALIWGAGNVCNWLNRHLKGDDTNTNQPAMFAFAWLTRSAAALALTVCLICSAHQLKYWKNGETLFRRALAINPENASACEGLGAALVRMGRESDALPWFAHALRLTPSLANAQFSYGTILLNSGRPTDALPHFEAVLQSLPNHLKARINTGCALVRLGRLAEARLQFEKAKALDPTDPQPRYALGTTLLMESKTDRAVQELSEAVRLDPSYVSKMVSLNPQSAALRYNLGTILLMQSQVPAAVEQLSEAVRLDSNSVPAHRNLAIALMTQGRPTDALQHFAMAARLEPDDPDLRSDLGQALLDQNRAEEAVNELTASLRIRPNDPKTLQRLALAQTRLHRIAAQ